MAKILVHITHGPEHPTRAALGFLVARSALEEGHSVSLFLAGDAVQLLREPVLDALVGLGTGRLREHYDALVLESRLHRRLAEHRRNLGDYSETLPEKAVTAARGFQTVPSGVSRTSMPSRSSILRISSAVVKSPRRLASSRSPSSWSTSAAASR